LGWEVRQIQSYKSLEHTLFVFRPESPENSRDGLQWLLNELQMPQETRFRVHGKGKLLIAYITARQAHAFFDEGYQGFRYAYAVTQALQELRTNGQRKGTAA
jgi:hypothetical protein